VGIFDLIRAFQRILKRFENTSDFREIVNDRYTVADKIEHLLDHRGRGARCGLRTCSPAPPAVAR
jgi:segregation and condensation protein A